jgi:hypothetical protein
MRHVCTEREIEREEEKDRLFELKSSLGCIYVTKTITYKNKQK